jgi:hypothetical protein
MTTDELKNAIVARRGAGDHVKAEINQNAKY